MYEHVRELYEKLHKGTYGPVDRPKPVAGDLSKLAQAHGLSHGARSLVQQARMVASRIPGTQQIRIAIGHAMFGARVNYGESLFITIAPSERHSGLRLRLARLRRNDTLLTHDPRSAPHQLLAGKDHPSLESTSVQLPEYEWRRQQLCRDPLSAMQAFHVMVRYVLARLLGIRMCPQCPHCNYNGSRSPCTDLFGSNADPMGGIFGMCVALGGATEHQRAGTPHFHGTATLANIYQYGTLEDVAAAIRGRLITVDDLKNFHRSCIKLEI